MKDKDYSRIGTGLEKLPKLTLDGTEETEVEVLSIFKTIGIVMYENNIQFDPDMQKYLVGKIIDAVKEFEFSRYGVFDINFEATDIFLNLTGLHTVSLSLVEELSKINMLSHGDFLAIVLNIGCQGYEGGKEVLEKIDLVELIKNFMNQIGSCLGKIIEEYRNGAKITDFVDSKCVGEDDIEYQESKLYTFASLGFGLTRFSSEIMKAEHSVATKFKEFLSETLGYMKNCLDIPTEGKPLIQEVKSLILQSLKAVLTHIEGDKFRSMIIDPTFEDTLIEILKENKSDELVQNALEILEIIPFSSKFIDILYTVATYNEKVMGNIIYILVGIVESDDEDLITYIFSEKFDNVILNYISSKDIEIEQHIYLLLRNLCDLGYSKLVPKESI